MFVWRHVGCKSWEARTNQLHPERLTEVSKYLSYGLIANQRVTLQEQPAAEGDQRRGIGAGRLNRIALAIFAADKTPLAQPLSSVPRGRCCGGASGSERKQTRPIPDHLYEVHWQAPVLRQQ